MEGEITVVIEFGVGPLLETIAEDDDTAAGRDLQVELNMPMTEDIVVAVVVLFLLFFGKKHQFRFVLTFVRTRVFEFFEAAAFRPLVAEFVAPSRRQRAETELQERRTEDLTQFHEPLDLFLDVFGVEFFPVGRQ